MGGGGGINVNALNPFDKWGDKSGGQKFASALGLPIDGAVGSPQWIKKNPHEAMLAAAIAATVLTAGAASPAIAGAAGAGEGAAAAGAGAAEGAGWVSAEGAADYGAAAAGAGAEGGGLLGASSAAAAPGWMSAEGAADYGAGAGGAAGWVPAEGAADYGAAGAGDAYMPGLLGQGGESVSGLASSGADAWPSAGVSDAAGVTDAASGAANPFSVAYSNANTMYGPTAMRTIKALNTAHTISGLLGMGQQQPMAPAPRVMPQQQIQNTQLYPQQAGTEIDMTNPKIKEFLLALQKQNGNTGQWQV